MPNKNLKQSFEALTPTQEQKERMLANILEKSKEKSTSKIIPFNHKVKPFIAVAASLVIVTSGIITLTQVGNNTISNSPTIPNQPQESPNLVVYNDMYYAYGEELTNLSDEDLIGPLDKIENLGGDMDILWELKGYDPKEVIVVEHLGSYYLCKNINQ